MAGIGLNRSRQAPAEDTPSFGAIAERFRRAGDLDRAIALCQEGLKKFPNQLSARVTLGWAYLDKGEYDHARQELERVIRRAPDNLAAIRGLAELHDRAEHAVSGLGPDGMWVPAEELPDEPEAAAPVEVQAAEPEPVPFEPATPAPSPPLPVPAITSVNDDINPLTLIETPAQAAVAHSGYAEEAAPAVSVFERVIEHAADAGIAASVEPLVQDAADWSELAAVTPAATPLAALQEIEEVWEPAVPATTEPASDAVLSAENANLELDRVVSEFGMVESDPAAAEFGSAASDVIIDLPEADEVLAGELVQFEATEMVEAEEAPAFEGATMDPMLPPAGIDAAEELEALGSVFSAAANEPEPDLVLHLDEEDLLDSQVDPVLTVDSEPEIALELDLAPERAPEQELQTPLVVEPAAAMVEVEEVGAATVEAAPEPEVTEVLAEVAPDLTTEPQLSSVFAVQPAVEVPAEPDVLAESEILPEPEPVVASEPVPPAVVDATSEAEPEEEGLVVAADVAVTDAAVDITEPGEEAAEPVELAAASAGEIDDADGDDSTEWAVPDVAWVPSAGDAAGVPAMAASAHLTEEEMNTLFPPPAPPAATPVRAPAPIARLEAFLQKVASRRLHLSPDSMA
jgi:hypothetical protein